MRFVGYVAITAGVCYARIGQFARMRIIDSKPTNSVRCSRGVPLARPLGRNTLHMFTDLGMQGECAFKGITQTLRKCHIQSTEFFPKSLLESPAVQKPTFKTGDALGVVKFQKSEICLKTYF
jgi:hypothetical protein